ncbi:hypothetical protein ACIA49_38670 [Kribbella sp. NPDC051587]|uniref:hypothetical protein n=1 Tax=Kribbella sp. NPDC051587 TaxID=3364119 RepID=UPI0037931690
MAARPSKALAAWNELNDRQQGTLTAIYEQDQAREASHRRDAARDWDNTPAAIWRRIDFAHDPAARDLLGLTTLQTALAKSGWDNQGNGATMAALESRGLITRGSYPTTLGTMLTVALTRHGRAVARTATDVRGSAPKPKAALSERSWQVLAQLWSADQAGRRLEWSHSTTIERVLIDRHQPPLAAYVSGGYTITDRGRDFYRDQYAVHTAAHPAIWAPHPDGPGAEPWPARADEILTSHQQHYRQLCGAWRQAGADHTAAQTEMAELTAPDPDLPAPAARLAARRRKLWHDTARRRADLAADHRNQLAALATHAAHAYAVTAIAAHRAAVAQTDPVDGLVEPGSSDDGDEQRLAPPAETGIPALDSAAKKLHAAAMGTPVQRRGPRPTTGPTPVRRRRRTAAAPPTTDPEPGRESAALADYLTQHLAGGALLRRLHPERSRPTA